MTRKSTRINRTAKNPRPTVPTWAIYGSIILMTVMLCLSINYRAMTVVNKEVRENQDLTSRIQNVRDENLQLQEDIHSLKSDPRVIQREAKRLGFTP